MRPILLLALVTPLFAAGPLQIVRPILSDSEGGAALPGGFEYIPGETLFFSCRVNGYQKTDEQKVHLTYDVDVFDSKGVPLVEPYKNEITEEVTPQDKEWQPKIQTEIPLPPLIGSGAYKIVIKAQDVVAKTGAELTVPFQVRGRSVAPSDTLVVRNLRFMRSESDTQPLEKAAYRPGDTVWAAFDITGLKYGPKNKVDVAYIVSILGSDGKVLWTQPEPTVEQSESFYPKQYVPAAFSITIQGSTRPGAYGLAIQVKDVTGGQTYDAKGAFTVE